jgi:uracil-DNA glycosylase
MIEDLNSKELEKIKQEVIDLKDSPLYQERIKNNVFPVIGEGNHNARIMFVGEAPGRNEALKGRPFCGRAGQILDELLSSVDIKRQDVYITNIVKDRPPSNRDPELNEIKAYSGFLDRQINIIKPEIIVGLGRFSSHYLLSKFNLENEIKVISLIHGKVFVAQADYGSIEIITMFHPASTIYDKSKKEVLSKSFNEIKWKKT